MRDLFLSRLTLLCACFLFCGAVNAQTFYKTLGTAALDEGGQAVCASPDGNYFVGGYRGDSALLMKIDPAGNEIWSRSFKPHAASGYLNSIMDLTISPDGYLVGCGNAYGGSPFTCRVGFIFKFDLNGNQLWKTVSTDPKAMRFIRLLPNSLNQYLLIINYWTGVYPYGDVLSATVDASSGAISWLGPQMDYMSTNPYQDDLMGGTIGSNGSVYSTGRCYINGSLTNSMRVFLTKYDSQGNHLWSKYLLQSSSNSAMMYGQDVLYDNDTLLLSYHGDNTGNIVNNVSVGLVCADTLGNVIWSKEYDLPVTREYAFEVMRTSFGYALMGHTAGSTNDNVFLIAVDRQGNLLWAKSYGTANPENYAYYSTTQALYTGNGFLFTARTIAGGDDDIVLARTDNSGNIACATVTNVNVTVTNNPTGNYPCQVAFVNTTLQTAAAPLLANTSIPAPCTMSSLDLGNDTSACNTLALNATVSGATQYIWQDGSTQATFTAPGPGTYWVNVYLNCCLLSDTIHISSSNPSANFASFVPACGTTAIFTNLSQNGATCQWDFGDSSSSTLSSPIHTYSSTGQYTVTLIVSNACGSDTSAHVVNVQPPPAVAAGMSAIAAGCTGSVIGFTNTSSNASTYAWDFGDGNTSTLASPSHTYLNAGMYTVTLIASASCASDTVTQTVLIAPAPAAQISGSDTICQGQTVTLTASGGGSYQWSGGATDTTAAITISPQTTTTYYVTVSDSLCSGAPDTFTVIVQPGGNALISGPDTICTGQSATLSASGGSSYQWSGGSSATTSSITVSPFSTTTYYVTAGTGNCAGPPDTLTLTVLPAPVSNVSGNTTICQGQSTTLTATGGGTYQWSGGATDTTAAITVSPSATTTYFVTVSNGFCTSAFASITVTVVPSPTVTIVGSTMLCPGGSSTLTGFGASTYVWGGVISATGQSVTANLPGNYFLVGYNSQGCSDTTMVAVGFYDVPTVTILGDDTICAGEASQLVCTGAGTFSWTPNTGLSSSSAQQVIATPTATITYSVTVISQQGCVGTDSFTLYVDPCTGIAENAAPENLLALYPNPGAGLFTVEWPGSEEWSLDVYDMRGRLVRSENAERSPTRQIDLRELQDGVYFLKANGEKNYASGRVLIVR